MRFAFMTLIFVKCETYCDVTACLFASATQFITNCDRYYKMRWLLQIATDTAVVFLRRVLEGMSWWPRKQVIKCTLEDVSFCDRDRAFIKNNLFFLMKEKKGKKAFLAWESSRHLATLPLVSPPNDGWETSVEIPYWWRVTTQNWVVLLIGWIKFPTRRNQSKALPRSGSWRVISMEFLRSFLRRHFAGTTWWRREMSAVFSG